MSMSRLSIPQFESSADATHPFCFGSEHARTLAPRIEAFQRARLPSECRFADSEAALSTGSNDVAQVGLKAA
ncbi:MAG: hypothetical protein HC861_10375 [Rhodospirillaceae bacterium]|nr:hypothetical protein [Rhodospirillaceae bacterium]